MLKKLILLSLTIWMIWGLIACETIETSTDLNHTSSESQTNIVQDSDESPQTELQDNKELTDTESSKENDTVPLETQKSPSEITDVTEESSHVHIYSDPTCTSPKKCLCGAIAETALGHQFLYATCTNPQICTRCGITNGNALGHSYSNATCTTPKKCTRCGTTYGSSLGHNWINATCTTARKCRVCNIISGNPIGHNYMNGICLSCNIKDPDYAQYTIIYNANGGWGETVDSTHLYGEARTLSKNGFKKAGYAFAGWHINPKSAVPLYTDRQIVKNLSKEDGDTVILYAIWKESPTSTLDECRPTNNSKLNVEYHTTAIDNKGITHNDVAIFANRDTRDHYQRSDERFVDGIFSRIKGTLYLSDSYTIDKYTKIRLIIKADGVTVFTSEYFEQDSGAQTFDVDISGTSVVKIYVECFEYNWIEYWNKGGDIMVQGLVLVR